jgi:translation elongation factor aEF-1 beta
MGTAVVKIKIMPNSPESDLKSIKDKAGTLIKKEGGMNANFMEEPIAFGLKAIFTSFAWPEEKELEVLEKKLVKIKDVKSAEVSDIRRAIG